MNIPTIPLSHQALQELYPLTTPLREYLSEAKAIGLPYFRKRDLAVNETLMSCMIRFEVGRLFRESGLQVEDESEEAASDFSLAQAALLGLAGTYRGYHFRILKSPDGTLPPPGPSERRQAFYAQQLQLFDFNGDPRNLRPNVVLLWRFPRNGSVPELFLAVPRSGNVTRASVQDHYIVTIPHPVSTVKPAHTLLSTDVLEPDVTRKAPITTRTESAEEQKTKV